jgi:SAM-dependent methyltransferase
MPEPVSRPLPSHGEFDEDAYRLLHPDVARAISDGIVDSGWQHYQLHGFAENRQWSARPDPLVGVSHEIAPGDEMLLGGNAVHYFEVGASALRCVESALHAVRRSHGSIKSILDLPCGHGRVLRFLKKAFPDAALTACDLNADGVQFCARAFGATPVVSRSDPAGISFDTRFDLIWCGSLFTHLSAERCRQFLDQFRRWLAPGGLLVFTLHGRSYEPRLQSGQDSSQLAPHLITALLDEYRREGFGYVDYRPSSGYGFSLANPAYVTARFTNAPGWRLTGYHEQGWDRRQDVVCLQRDLAN